MPTVPSSFVPQANLQDGGDVPLQAPGVEPVRNLAADQQVQLGEAMTRAGNVAWNVGSNIQDAIDEAGAKAADVQFLQSTQQLLNGQNGYMNMQGVDAESNFQAVNDAMIQSASGIADGLKNDTQKQMFKQAASRNLLAFQGQVLNHRNKKVQVLAVTAAEARTNEYVGLAVNDYNKRNQTADVVVNGVTTKIPVGSFNANVGVAMAEVREIGRLQGFAENSAQMKELERKVWSQVTTGVTNRLMIDGKLQSAMNYVKEQNKAGHLDTNTADSLLKSIDANIDRIAPTEIASNIWSTGIADSQTTGGYQLPIDGAKMTIPPAGAEYGVDIDAPPGTPVLAPFDGMVESVTTTDGVTDIVMMMDDGVKIKMSGLADGNMVEAGQRLVTGEQLSTARKEPMRYQAIKNDKSTDPRNLNNENPKINREKAKPPETVQEALKIVTEQITDPTLRARAKASVIEQYEQQQAYAKEQYMEVFNSVIDMNVAEMNPILFGRLSPKDQQFALKEQRERNDLDFEVQLAENPEILTKEWVFENRELMTKETRKDLLNKINSKDFALTQAEASFDRGILEVELINNGLSKLVNPKEDADKQTFLILQQTIKNAIYQKQISQKTTLSPLEKREVIDRVLLDRASVGDAGPDTTNVIVGSMTEAQRTTAYYTIQGVEIPLSAYRNIERKGNEALLKLGINSKVTQEEVMQAYKAMTEKPKRQSTPTDQMPVYVPSSGFGIR
jgi:murein DD-endopeptidase MepM/ murein hydrolase activator NlpD